MPEFKMTIKNYKSFKQKQKITFKPITIFVGPNSAGKSSILKLLDFLSRNILNKSSNDKNKIIFSNGDFKSFDHLTNNYNGLPVEIGIETSIVDKKYEQFESHFTYWGNNIKLKYIFDSDSVKASFKCEKNSFHNVDLPELRDNIYSLSKQTRQSLNHELEKIKHTFIETLSLITGSDYNSAKERYEDFVNTISEYHLLYSSGFQLDLNDYSFSNILTPTTEYYEQILKKHFTKILQKGIVNIRDTETNKTKQNN